VISVSAPIGPRLRHDERKLPDLVAAEPERQRVVALDEETRAAAHDRREARHRFDRRRLWCEWNRRNSREGFAEGGGGHRRALYSSARAVNKDLLAALRSESSVFAAELRPPRAELAGGEGMDAWIDTYHAVRRLTRQGTFVFLTDSAVGEKEEDNLRHLVINLGNDVPRERIVPFLTSKHSVEYCLSYAERAHQSGFPALVVLGGDKQVGTPRCLEHAWQLRQLLRDRDHTLALGGWATPTAIRSSRSTSLRRRRSTPSST